LKLPTAVAIGPGAFGESLGLMAMLLTSDLIQVQRPASTRTTRKRKAQPA
jgi:hypothetical protein